MKKVFIITNKNLILLTPLLLYTLFSSIYLAFTASSGKLINIVFSIILFLLMSAAFSSGWFNMIKVVIKNNCEIDDSLFKQFPSGVGEYFLQTLGAIINIIIFSFIIIKISFLIGNHFIGDVGVSAEAFAKALESTEALKTFILSLSNEQILKISNWHILIMCFIAIASFVLMLYFPTIFYKEKNPYKAFLISLKDTFSKKIFKTLGLFSLIIIVNFVISLLSALFSTQSIIHFIITIANFYFITLVGVSIFYYYNTNFVETQIGKNIDVEI